MTTQLNILCIDDSPLDFELIVHECAKNGYDVEWSRVDNELDLRRALGDRRWDIVLCDYVIPGFGGEEALKIVRAHNAQLPFIFVSGAIGEEMAVEAVQHGAHDYVMKHNLKRLVPAIERALREQQVMHERNHMHDQLEFLAHHDPLTKLANRVLFKARLNQAIHDAERCGRRVSVAFIDLNRFKLVNDSLGHAAGDQLLQEVAARLERTVRKSDTVARLAGDEFALVLSNLGNDENVAAVIEGVVGLFHHPFRIEEQEIYSSASVGLAMFPTDANDSENLIRCADIAMYVAKNSGGGYRFYTSDLTSRVRERLRVEMCLRKSLSHDDFVVHYQPLVSIENGQTLEMEALVRMPTERGLEFPATFIPVAEAIGLISAIGERVLRRACADCEHWRRSGFGDLRISVNFSTRQLQFSRLREMIEEIIGATGIDPTAVVLEITEGALMNYDQNTTELLARLREIGLRISLDDFGTGYSSLDYLRRVPLNAVKIDQSFTKNLLSNSGDREIVKAIISVAKCFGLKVVAEGVETREQLSVLRSEHCDIAQGYYIAHPLPADDVLPWLHAQRERMASYNPGSGRA